MEMTGQLEVDGQVGMLPGQVEVGGQVGTTGQLKVDDQTVIRQTDLHHQTGIQQTDHHQMVIRQTDHHQTVIRHQTDLHHQTGNKT